MINNLLVELWSRRSLIKVLTLSDIKVRYRGSALGIAWSMLEPLLMFTVLYFVFTTILRQTIPNYPIYLIMGLIFWNTFLRATSMNLNGLGSKRSIITSIYIPRELFVLSTTLASFIITAFEFAVLVIFFIGFQFLPPITIVFLPIPLIALFILSIGFSLPLSVLNIHFKDTGYIWGVITHAGYFITPILYSPSFFSGTLQTILYLNPMTWILEAARNYGIYGIMVDGTMIAAMFGFAFTVLAIGYLVFKKYDKKVAEVI